MCDSEQNDEPIDDDDDYDYLEESSETNRNTTDTLTPSSDIANDANVSSAIKIKTVKTTTPLAPVSNIVNTLTSTTHKRRLFLKCIFCHFYCIDMCFNFVLFLFFFLSLLLSQHLNVLPIVDVRLYFNM